MSELVKAGESVAGRRTIYLHLVQPDGITPATGEAGGQPQISTNGGAWTDTGIGTLSAAGNGRYAAVATQAAVATAGDEIETRYKSANTAECPGQSVRVVAFDPYAADLGLWGDGGATATRLGHLGLAYDRNSGVLEADLAGHVLGRVLGYSWPPLPKAPLAYWRFDGTSSAASGGLSYYLRDWSGNGYTLSAVSTAPTFPAGKFGSGINVSTGVQNAGPVGSLNVGDPWTVLLWVYGATGVPTGDVIWADDQGTFAGYGFGPSESHAYVQASGGGTGVRDVTGLQLASGIWKHVAVVNDTAAMSLYVDGVLIGSSAGAPAGALSGAFQVFAGANGTVVDEVAVVAAALTLAEVKAVAARGPRALYDVAAEVDVEQWRAAAPSALQSGRVDSYLGAGAAGVVTATLAPNLNAAVSSRAAPGDAMALTVAERAAAADKLLGRNLAGGSDGGRTVKDALRAARNKVAFDVPGIGQFTVFAEDDVTPAWVGTYTRAAVDALVGVDPA